MNVIRETNFDFLGPVKRGKVRDIYEKEGKVILVATDRHSSFDRIIAHIPRKGEVLNLLSAFWMDKTKDIMPNHIVAVPDPNVTVARKCAPVPIEAVVRGYLTGVTSTSIWTHYKAGKRDFGNFVLPDGMKKNQKLSKPVFTPSTKQDTHAPTPTGLVWGHDRSLSPQEIVAEKIVTKDLLEQIEAKALALFMRGQELAAERGLILVDTKYEFGISDSGALTLIDEVHTPDSSRWWYLASYDERTGRGEEPEYFDKEFLRLWFNDHSDPYKDAVLPEAPPDMVAELSRRYQVIYHELVGEDLPVLSSEPIARIEKNLRNLSF
jgi:phosphoribosylaminoimidazole-succinocarboxamide synthase